MGTILNIVYVFGSFVLFRSSTLIAVSANIM